MPKNAGRSSAITTVSIIREVVSFARIWGLEDTLRKSLISSPPAVFSFLQILAPELNDRLLADFLDMESSLIVSMHIQSVDQVKAIKTVKRKITDLDRSKIEEQKKAVRAGYDMDIIPSDLATYGSEAKKLLQDLQSRNERMFLLTFLVLNTADNPRQLGNNIFQPFFLLEVQPGQLTVILLGNGACLKDVVAKLTGIVRCVHHTGIIPERQGGAVLRHQCSVQQPHHGGPKAAEKETAPYFLPIRNCLPVRNSKELGAIKSFVDRPEGASQSHSN